MVGSFIKVKCSKCSNEQNIFEKPAGTVKCLVCESILAESKGGKADIKAEIIEKTDENGKMIPLKK
ncbi:MAG: 30S ribosomal protein S27e [Candidatus Aenigmarchaeota archaeon]|nr:30S ribosomal protein S27e [Candidatus Aenigmarchaeota archaeon]